MTTTQTQSEPKVLSLAELINAMNEAGRFVEIMEKLSWIKGYLNDILSDEELLACKVSTIGDLIAVRQRVNPDLKDPKMPDENTLKQYVQQMQREGFDVKVGEKYLHLLQ